MEEDYQVEGHGAAQQEARVHVHGVVLVLNDPGQAADDGADGGREDQQGLQQLGRVCQRAVEVHLRTHNTSRREDIHLGAVQERTHGRMDAGVAVLTET